MTGNEIQELIDAGGILIGSQALGVAETDSDYDIAIKAEDLPHRYKNNRRWPTEAYFSVLPMGNSSLIRNPEYFDIMIYDDPKDFDAVVTALQLVKCCPIELLADKPFRVLAFETALTLTKRFK